MCIRDRQGAHRHGRGRDRGRAVERGRPGRLGDALQGHDEGCLLYTSDAADERSSVDLGGRRIIKKKTREQLQATRLP